MKTRNIPVRLSPDEWQRAHEATRAMREAMTAQRNEVPEESWTVSTGAKRNMKNQSARRRDARDRVQQYAGVCDETLPQPLNAVGDWERLDWIVDSGAAETICPAAMARGVPTEPGEKFKMGASYTCASGKPLPNLGEKKCYAYFGDSGTARGMRMQVADVSRPLMSVSRAVDSGCRVVFDQNWSYIEDKATGERTSIERRGGLYVMESWLKAKPSGTTNNGDNPPAPFHGPGPRK